MLSAHGVQVLQLSFVKVTHSLSVLSLPASAPGWESLLSMICPQHDSLDSMVANYIVTHRMHPHTPLIWYNWQGLGYCYIIHLLSCCRVLTITFQSGEPPPSALRYALPCPEPHRPLCSSYSNIMLPCLLKDATSEMLTLKQFQRLLLVPADPAVRQRSPQNRCWRSSVSDAHHSWQLFLQPA